MYKNAEGIEAYIYEDKLEDADAGSIATPAAIDTLVGSAPASSQPTDSCAFNKLPLPGLTL